MTFVRKFSGDRTAPIVCVYTCPEHGEFDAEVKRDEEGSPPDVIACGLETRIADQGVVFVGGCTKPATWTPTPIACSVRRVEAVRGNWEKPERKTFLDTRRLGEGQDPEEFRAERKRIWNEERHKRVKELLR